MFGHPLLWLAIATLLIVAGLAMWNLASTLRQQKYGNNVEGLGGQNDPLA